MSTTPRHYTAQAQPADALPGRFRTLQYQPTPSEHWYHVLFGHVPRFQMDFILRPELPYRKFRPQHFAHLGPQIKFLSPAAGLHYAVAIGNLSSNDTQHVAGRGGLSLLVSTRVAELRDHAQRESPVFAHSLIAVDEPLTTGLFSLTVATFVERVLDDGVRFYRSYYTSGQADNFERIYNYVRSLHDLPDPWAPTEAVSAELAGAASYSSDAPPPYNQILIDCRGINSRQVLQLAARLAVILYRTNLKWTTITTGSEEFEPKIYHGEDYSIAVRLICGGVTIEDAERQARGMAPGSRIITYGFADLSTSDTELGAQLFGLPGATGTNPPRLAAHSCASSFSTQVCPSSDHPANDHGGVEPHAMPLPGSTELSNLRLTASSPESGLQLPGGPLPAPATKPVDDRRATGWIGPAVLCGLFGLVLGAAGAWLLLQEPALAILQSRPKAPRHAPRSAATDRPDSREAGGASPDMPAAPAVPRASEDVMRDARDPATRRALAENLSDQAKPIAAYASATQKRARQVLATHDSPPWRKLQAESDLLRSQLQKMNHVGAALSEPGSVYNIGSLVDSYCQVLSTYKSVQQIESNHRLERVPNP